MSALPVTFVGLKPSPHISESETINTVAGKPVVSVTRRNPTPIRKVVLQTPSLFSLPIEPEDARITGGTRSLNRRLLALNLYKTRLGKSEDYRKDILLNGLIDSAAAS